MNSLILYNNIITIDGTLTASGTESGYDVDNTKDYRPNTFWMAAAAGTNYVKVSFPNVKAFSGCGIGFHNLNSVGATISIQYSSDDSNWTTLETVTPLHDNVLILTWSITSARYWRLLIVNSSGLPYVGVFFLGAYLDLASKPVSPVYGLNESINAEIVDNKNGIMLGANVRNNPVDFTHSFKNLTRNFVDIYYKPFWNYAKGMNWFFYSWDNYNSPNDAVYCRMKDSFINQKPVSRLDYYDQITIDAYGYIK